MYLMIMETPVTFCCYFAKQDNFADRKLQLFETFMKMGAVLSGENSFPKGANSFL